MHHPMALKGQLRVAGHNIKIGGRRGVTNRRCYIKGCMRRQVVHISFRRPSQHNVFSTNLVIPSHTQIVRVRMCWHADVCTATRAQGPK